MTTTVHLVQGMVQTVAAKMYTADTAYVDEDPDVIGQLKAWDVYQKASLEARVMHQLSHPNILALVGVTLRPLSLLVELAPQGDLRKCMERYKAQKVKLSRRTMQCTLIQVQSAIVSHLASLCFSQCCETHPLLKVSCVCVCL